MLLALINEPYERPKHTFEHVETDAAETIDVGVVDAREEADLGRGHRVVIWEEELGLEHTTCLPRQYDCRIPRV
jgi:hypothetical protein